MGIELENELIGICNIVINELGKVLDFGIG